MSPFAPGNAARPEAGDQRIQASVIIATATPTAPTIGCDTLAVC